MRKKVILLLICLLSIFGVWKVLMNVNLNPSYEVGQVVDSLNSVKVYYNGGVGNVEQRNVVNGYNIGLKYQCVEFVKRYYYEYYNHKMPDTYGHAEDFFERSLGDGAKNIRRDLVQYHNPSSSKPKIGDLIVMNGIVLNPYGHVAIISEVNDNMVQIIQQNSGPFSSTREWYELSYTNNEWFIHNDRILGWLRK